MLQSFDKRNANLKVMVNNQIYSRDEGAISVFDSVVQGGDAVWEGLRCYAEGILGLNEHLRRLGQSAHALAFEGIPAEAEIKNQIWRILEANDMTSGVHIRLTLTRGIKITSGMDPRLNQNGCTLIIVPEYKEAVYDNEGGIRIITSSQRRNNPQFLDSKIHHNNLLNNIIAKIQANVAGVDAALMLDERGFVSELNGTNIFMINGSHIHTPYATNCLPGITRQTVMNICSKMENKVIEADISLTQLYNADCVFTTGTMGELTPVVLIDGREIGNKDELKCELFQQLKSQFLEMIPQLCESIRK